MYGQSESVTSAIFFFCIGSSLPLSFRVTRYETLILLSATLSKFFLTRPCTASNAFATWISIIGNSLAYWATNFRVLMKHRKNFFFFWLLLVPFFTRTNLKKEIIITQSRKFSSIHSFLFFDFFRSKFLFLSLSQFILKDILILLLNYLFFLRRPEHYSCFNRLQSSPFSNTSLHLPNRNQRISLVLIRKEIGRYLLQFVRRRKYCHWTDSQRTLTSLTFAQKN